MKEVIESPDKISAIRKRGLLRMELQGWLNGRYIHTVRLAIAEKLKDQQTAKAALEELKTSEGMIESLQRQFHVLGVSEVVDSVPAQIRKQLLEQELLDRNDQVYIFQLRANAAHQVKNKQLEETATTMLERNLGFVDGLKKELRRVNEELKGPSKKV